MRKLLPESWGFLCPVHTPDGSPCGLLNHFTAACSIITEGPAEPQARELGLIEVRQRVHNTRGPACWVTQVDVVVGL